jgi:hypothetical protein
MATPWKRTRKCIGMAKRTPSGVYVVGGVTYEVGKDKDGNARAKTYNQKHKIQVELVFSPIENPEAAELVLSTLKRDYLDKCSACG